MPRDLEALIHEYEPVSVAPGAWARVRPFFMEVMWSLGLTDRNQFKRTSSHVVQLLVWAGPEGVPLEVEHLFHVDVIERYVSQELTGRSAATVRSRLRAIGEMLTKDGGYKGRAPALAKGLLDPPHVRREVDLLKHDAAHQPSPELCWNFKKFLALGLGIGTSAGEAAEITGTAFRREPEALVARVNGREIPVMDEWSDILEEAAVAAGRGLLLPRRPYRGKTSDLAKMFVLGASTPQLVMGRLRHTWMVACLETPTITLPDLLNAAGLTTCEIPNRLLPYLSLTRRGDRRRAFKAVSIR